jgi:outer membrane biosynthesis protein TonB
VRFPPVFVASVVMHLGVAVLAAAMSPHPPRALLRPRAATVDLDLAPPPPPPPVAPPPVAPPPVVPPPVPPPSRAAPSPAAAARAVARPTMVATTTSTVLTSEGSLDPVPVAVPPVAPGARAAGVAPVPSNLRATSLLTGARDLSLQIAAAQPTDAQRREEIRAIALAPIVEGLHANDHMDVAGTARASRVLSTRVAEEIASRISVPALTPAVDRAPSIDLPAYRPSESAGERMAASELDAVHSNSFTSASFGPGSPACSSYHALLVDVAITDGDAGLPAVSLLHSSGVAALDRSVLEVAREVAAEASAPGTTRWRFELANDAGRCARWGGWRPLAGGDLRVRFRRMHGR